MSSIDRNKIRKLILKEFKMIGMADMGHGGMQPMGFPSSAGPIDSHRSDIPEMEVNHDHSEMNSPKSCVSREDCCAAIMCLVECCECPITKQVIMECCQEIMSGQHDR